MSGRILFVCTGNYYRSRFAEILFNELCRQKKIQYQAFSKGLRLSKNNKGPISKHCLAYFSQQYPDLNYELRMPIPLDRSDFDFYDQIIVMDQTEHRPMIEKSYPTEKDKVVYWSIVDDYIQAPELVLPILENKVIELSNQLNK